MNAIGFTPLALAALLAAGAAQAGTAVTTTHVIAVGQVYLEKAIRVRETAARHGDVETVAEAFRKHGAQVQTLVEQQLTRDALKTALARSAKAMKPQDRLVFYFSGFSGQVQEAPALFVQGSGDKPGELLDGSRILPWGELQGWLSGSGAPALFVVMETGPDSTRFCGPWNRPGQVESLTVVCAAPSGMPGKTGELAAALAAGLDGGADGNGDATLTGDELAAWLRRQLRNGASVYQSGPVSRVLGRSKATPLADSGKTLLPGVTAAVLPLIPQPADKLDVFLRTIATQAGDAKVVAGLLQQTGVVAPEGLLPVAVTLTGADEIPRVVQRIEQLGGRVEAHVGHYLYARLAPAALLKLAEQETVWSMATALPNVVPMR